MTTKYSFSAICICSIILIVLAGCCAVQNNTSRDTNTLYSRIIRDGKIKASYIVYPPVCIKDPNTGKLFGIAVDILEEAGKHLGLKIDWVEEVGWGTAVEGLKSNRYDVVGMPLWTNSDRGKVIDFSHPLFYSAICAYVRPNDNRFSKDLKAINSPEVKIATIDGETADFICRSLYPKAKRVSLPQLSDVSQMLLNVVQNKADVAFVEPAIAQAFLKTNPNSLKNVSTENPVAVFGNSIAFNKGEGEFKSMLDNTIDELSNMGIIDQIISKYEPVPNTFYRVALPYKQVKVKIAQ